jgi:tartrate dehydratase beta subunit/fumarate hydratase class I family protein
MGSSTGMALKKYGAVYCDFPGGAAVLAASKIKKVLDVKWLDLGLPEAVWVFRVENFGPLVVSMDSHGGNLRSKVKR